VLAAGGDAGLRATRRRPLVIPIALSENSMRDALERVLHLATVRPAREAR